MSSSKNYIQYLAAVLLLSACMFEQASSIKCYFCDSNDNPDCIYNPSRFGVTCSPFARDMNSSVSDNQDALPYDCATAVGIDTLNGRFRVVRGCAIQPVNCQTYQIVYAANLHFQVENCLRCGYNLCNSATKF